MEPEKTLSQKEIDALLSILPSDGSPLPGGRDRFVGSARAYDFRSPDKFSKEQIRTLQMIHETFAKRASSSLSAYIRASVSMACVHIEQGTFSEFVQNMPSPGVYNVFGMAPLPGRILVALDTGTATVAIDRLLGGIGRPAEADHEITDIEQSLMQGVTHYVVGALQEAWRNVIALTITVEETALTPEFLQVTSPTDAAVFLAFEIKIRDFVGSFSVCIPYAALKPIMSRLSPHNWVAGESKEAGAHKTALVEHLRQVQVGVSVQLGEVNVAFEDLLQLQSGDVLVLNTVAGRPLPIMIESSRKYVGYPGLMSSNLAAQIAAVTEERGNE